MTTVQPTSPRPMAHTTEKRPASERPIGKRLIVGCDGTWNNSDAGTEKSWTGKTTLQIPSNVTRLIRAVAPISSTGTLQVSYYQRGVGSDGDLENSLIGGLTADDITEKIREAYGFICNNYGPREQKDIDDDTKARDEIVLLGFSRGAFTARAISSLITDVGLLTKVGLESFYGIVEDWKNQNMPGKEWQWFQSKYGKVDKTTFGWAQYRDTLAKADLTRTGVPIKAVGVFDTVGSLGIPRPYTSKVQEFSFVNTKVAQSIQYAFHALALDEHRGLFPPTLWEGPNEPNNLVKMKQCWFPGVHSNVGGGYADAGVSNITLAWMISQLEENKIVEFDTEYEGFVQDLNKEYYKKQPPPRSWGLGRIYDSAGSIAGMLEDLPKGTIARTPGNYNRIDDQTGKETNTPLQNTHEYMHRSVRVRIQEHGLGAEEDPIKPNTIKGIANGIEKLIGLKKDPEPYTKQIFQDQLAPLKGFEIIWPQGVPKGGDPEISNLGYSGIFWKDTVKGKERVLPEDEFLATERAFLLRMGGK